MDEKRTVSGTRDASTVVSGVDIPPRFEPGDTVLLDPSTSNFPASGQGPWIVEEVALSVPGSPQYGYRVNLAGFNWFHESWFMPMTDQE